MAAFYLRMKEDADFTDMPIGYVDQFGKATHTFAVDFRSWHDPEDFGAAAIPSGSR